MIISSNPAVWSEEWNTHGTCFETPTFKIADYFRLALYLFWRSDVEEALNKSGLEPINGRLYQTSDIETALTKSFNGKPALRCTLNLKYILQSNWRKWFCALTNVFETSTALLSTLLPLDVPLGFCGLKHSYHIIYNIIPLSSPKGMICCVSCLLSTFYLSSCIILNK